MQWLYQINHGLIHPLDPGFNLLFGAARTSVREKLGYTSKLNKGRFNDEDSYDGMLGEKGQWVRLGFKKELLFEIEVLNGEVLFADVVIKTHTDLQTTLHKLSEKGYSFQEWDYGFINHRAKIDLGDSEKNGGEPNSIHWILLSQNHDHIMQLNAVRRTSALSNMGR